MPENTGKKKNASRAAFVLLVILALLAGLSVPWDVRRIEDRRVLRQNEGENAFVARKEFEVDPELTLPEKLRLAGNNVFLGPYPRIGARTNEEMKSLSFPESTLETVRLFLGLWYDEEDADLALENVGMVQAESYYAREGSAKDGFITSVVWRCRFIDGKGNVMWLVVDDVTEEVLSFRLIVRDLGYRLPEGKAPVEYDLLSEGQWKEFAENSLSVHYAPYKVRADYIGSDPGNYELFSLEFSDGKESVECHLEIMKSAGNELIVNFNHCATEW